jgi:hypothetical protein
MTSVSQSELNGMSETSLERQQLGRCILKSCTRNQTNIQALRSDKRIDALVKKQESEHQHIISSHHKEMQELRDSLALAKEKFQSLFVFSQNELEDFKTYAVCNIGLLRQKITANETTIAEQKKTIEDLNRELQVFHSLYASKIDMENFKKAMTSQITEVVTCNINGFQECQSHLTGLFNSLREDLTKSKEDTAKKFSEVLGQIEKNFHSLKIDRDGVLKEVRVWEKTIFIIEKKIENIYTLIERINKRGETCPRPE